MRRCKRGHFMGHKAHCTYCRRTWDARYEATDAARERLHRYRTSARGRATKAAQMRRYRTTLEGAISQARHHSREALARDINKRSTT